MFQHMAPQIMCMMKNFMFDIYPNRVETVKKLCDYVATRYPDESKIFSHGVEIQHVCPPKI